MNAFDYVAIAALLAAARRGYRQGLARELYRLLRWAVALLAGTGLFGLVSGWITRAAGVAAGWTEPLAFVGITGGIWYLLRSLRKWLEAWLLLHTPRRIQAAGGAVASVAKTAILLGGLIAIFHLATWLPGHSLVAEKSLAAKIAKPFLAARNGE
ncbi:MAG TPA: hypothetical protein DCM68_03775 [Verrucomicrobia bacterium]|nr:hypothetical protein [Verrucomicrobiota bacterium]